VSSKVVSGLAPLSAVRDPQNGLHSGRP